MNPAQQYGPILLRRSAKNKITPERYWFLVGKLSQWERVYLRVIEWQNLIIK